MTAFLLIVRPCVLFSSPAVQAAYQQQIKVYGIAKTVRKRRQLLAAIVVYKEEESKLLIGAFPAILLKLLRTFQRRLLACLSVFLSTLSLLLFPRRTLFEVVPCNAQYLSISVFRI